MPPMPMQPQPMQQPPAQPPMQGDAPEGEQPPAAPSGPQQGGGAGGDQALARLLVAARKAIYENKQVTDQIVQSLQQGADNPAQAVCDATMHVLDGLAGQIKGGMPPQAAYLVAPAVVKEIGELGQHAGIFKWDDQEEKLAMQYITEKVRGRLQGGGEQPGQPQPGQPQQPGQQPPPGPPQAAGPGPGQAQPGGLLNQEVY